MTEFVNDPANVSLDGSTRTVQLSKIFDWFNDDFLDYERRQDNANPNVIDYVNRYREADVRIPREFRIEFLEYDKRINKQG